MAHISNPPLDQPARSRSAADRHTSGPIVNPPLDGSRPVQTAGADEHGNPPLDKSAATAIPSGAVEPGDVLDNPLLDGLRIEAWFEEHLGSDIVPTTKPTPTASPAATAATTPRGTRKQTAKKTTTKTARTAAKKTTKKAASKGSSGAKRTAGKRR